MVQAPSYNEFPKWSPNNQSRDGTKIDMLILHTQEGGGGNAAAEDLANFLDDPSSQVSYHTVLSEASDSGVTVVDVVDTDLASWSVLSANDRSINYCFAGSHAAWTRDQWLQQSNAIDVAAYLAVQDCRKYGIPLNICPPPYTNKIPGITDHAYVTEVLKDGTHTDVGPNFPWDVFKAAVEKYSGADDTTVTTPVVVTPPATTAPVVATSPSADAYEYPSTDDMIKQLWEQFFGPEGKGWYGLFGTSTVDPSRGMYPVEAIAALYQKVGK